MTVIERFKESEGGQSLVEFALVFPLFLFLVLGMVDFGRLSTADTQLTNATQEAAKEFSYLADTPQYRQWYIEDVDKPDPQRRINQALKKVVTDNVNTVPADKVAVSAKRSGDDNEKVVVQVTADVPSLSQFTFKERRVQRKVTLRIPTD